MKLFLQMLKNNGVTIPFVTLGKDGAATYIDGNYYRFEIPSVDVKNAVGSGDSTVAGIANTQFEQTGVVTTDLVREYYNQIKISTF